MRNTFVAVMALVLAVGCSRPVADVDAAQAFIAVAGAYSLLDEKPPAPKPDKPGACAGCHGLGYVGDGVTKTTCLACGGTGVEPKSVLAQPRCKDGKCSTPSIGR